MKEYDIFISYSRKDAIIVNTFVERFEQEGLRVWIDYDGIESGEAFKKVIVRAICKCKCFVFFSSESSNKSEWTTKEIGIAVDEKIHIIPVKLDNSKYNDEVRFDLINLDFVDYRNSLQQDSSMAKLVQSLKKICLEINHEEKKHDEISKSPEFVSETIPEWNPENCIQCNQCSDVCPHLAISPCVLTDEEWMNSPFKAKTLNILMPKEFRGMHYRIQISPTDCTGCNKCVERCPGVRSRKALNMKYRDSQSYEINNWNYSQQKVSNKYYLLPEDKKYSRIGRNFAPINSRKQSIQ